MKYLLLPLISCLFFCSFTCNKPGENNYTLMIVNNAPHNINYYVAALGIQHMYPDTAIQDDKLNMRTIQPGKTDYWSIRLSWEKFFKELPTDTLSVYIFHADTVRLVDWSMIRNEYKVKRYDLSLDDLKKIEFKLTYP